MDTKAHLGKTGHRAEQGKTNSQSIAKEGEEL